MRLPTHMRGLAVWGSRQTGDIRLLESRPTDAITARAARDANGISPFYSP